MCCQHTLEILEQLQNTGPPLMQPMRTPLGILLFYISCLTFCTSVDQCILLGIYRCILHMYVRSLNPTMGLYYNHEKGQIKKQISSRCYRRVIKVTEVKRAFEHLSGIHKILLKSLNCLHPGKKHSIAFEFSICSRLEHPVWSCGKLLLLNAAQCFLLCPCKLSKVDILSAAASTLVLVPPAFSVDPLLNDEEHILPIDKRSSIFLKPYYRSLCTFSLML